LNRYKNPVVIGLIIATAWLSSVLFLYILNIQNMNNFMAYMSGWAAIGLFILTIFYVLFTGSQIQELKQQRMLQIQPYPEIDYKYAVLHSPRICFTPFNGEVSIVNDLSIFYKIKNIGNGPAITIDLYGYIFGKKIKHKESQYDARRIKKLEINESLDGSYSFRYEDTRVLDAINQSNSSSQCPGETAFDLLVKMNLLYRNVAGQTFKIENSSILGIDSDGQKEIDSWIIANNSLKDSYNEYISKIKVIFNRDFKEARQKFVELRNDFYKRYPPNVLKISILQMTNKVKIDFIDSKNYEKISNLLHHGIPIGRKENQELEREFEEKKVAILNSYKVSDD